MAARRQFAEDESACCSTACALCRDRIAPRAEHFDRPGEFPWDNVEAINELGLNAMFIPEAYGGAPVSYAAYLACVREITKACAATGIIWATNFHAMKPLIDCGTEEQKQRLLPVIAKGGLASLAITEPDAGSDATGMRTTFTEEGDSIVINGGKTFITNGDVADLYLLFGKWAAIDDPREGDLGAWFWRRARRVSRRSARRQDGHARLEHGDARVRRLPRAARNLLGEPGDGLKILLASLNKSRPSVAAHALGIARAAFRGRGRLHQRAPAVGQQILEFQGIQFMLADLAAELALCEAWLWHVAAHGRSRRDGLRHRSFDAQDARLRPRDAHDDRRRAAARRLRLLQGLSRRAPDARRQDHADLGRHEPDPPPVHRPQFPEKVGRTS